MAIDYQIARERMVREQVFDGGIRDRRVLRAMLEVPRHVFVDSDIGAQAYTSHAFPIGFSQTMSQPFMVGYLTEQLALEGGERVLEIGTGSGYQAAVMARIAAYVYTIERIPELAAKAKKILSSVGIRNIGTRVGDGALGWPDKAPFERILLTAAAVEIPELLIEQLTDGGFLLGPVVTRTGQQEVVRIVRDGERFTLTRLKPCSFVPLIRGEKSSDSSASDVS